MRLFVALLGLLLFPSAGIASDSATQPLDLTTSITGIFCLIVFATAYVFVILEEKLHLRKSKPVLLAAGIIWVLIAIAYASQGRQHELEPAIRHNFLEYTELFFFLLVAMTYINSLIERGLFDELRNWTVSKGFSYRKLFWLTGFLAFFISPIADNLTTALILCAVILAVGEGKPNFIGVACVNIVVAANAGGAFSPFGDITTLMVWQKGILQFQEFFSLFLPSLVNYVVPALIMQFAVPVGAPAAPVDASKVSKPGAYFIAILLLLTILTAVSFHNFLHLPPVYGMMLGLVYLKFYGYYLRRRSVGWGRELENPPGSADDPYQFDVFAKIAEAEWDTLFFFYGIIMAVGGLGLIGYLGATSEFMYGELGPTVANVLVGLLSAVVDNIPVMFAVLTMNPDMSQSQWLLVTLTAGVGGSLLSIGSAAGVALMGQARGYYTFFVHLKWMPVIALGYGASIWVHFLVNS